MNGTVWKLQLDQLRQGELRIAAAGESGLTEYASTSLYELREYVKALEKGYRRLWEARDNYRRFGQGRIRGKTIQELADNQWSDGACLGYALLGLRAAGFRPWEVVCALEAIETAMGAANLEQAAAAMDEVRKDGEDESFSVDWGDTSSALRAPSPQGEGFVGTPEWIGASAELKPELDCERREKAAAVSGRQNAAPTGKSEVRGDGGTDPSMAAEVSGHCAPRMTGRGIAPAGEAAK